MTIRDRQRQRVYDWENTVVQPQSSRIVKFEQAQAFVDGVWLALGLRFPPRVELMPAQAKTRWATGNRARLQLRDKTPAWIILHELAHSITQEHDKDHESHGADFVGVYIKLLEKVLNIPTIMLMYTLKEHGVRYNLAAQPKFIDHA